VNPDEERVLVTLHNHCVRAVFQRRQPLRNRDGVACLFHLFDLTTDDAPPFLLSIFAWELDDGIMALNPEQTDIALWNTIRWQLDSGKIALDQRLPNCKYTEVAFQAKGRGRKTTDEEIQTFIKNKCVWLGYKLAENPRKAVVDLTEPVDLAYLGATQADVNRDCWLLTQQGLLGGTTIPGVVLATLTLIEQHQAKSKVSAVKAIVHLDDLPGKKPLFDAVAELLKSGRLASIVFIDLDGFKAVNDTFDHTTGTRCLETVVSILGRVVATRGQLYRYGGDEFVVVMPDFSTTEAAATGERIRAAIDSANPGGAIKVTCSIGIACSEDGGSESAEALIASADEAMYVAKRTTKNRVVTWPLGAEDAALAAQNAAKRVLDG
jgi:diguanylate cyclase (GGDEF)-like protein